MTIFRFKCLATATALVAACSQSAQPKESELERIKAITDIERAASELQNFVEKRQPHLDQMRRELATAGFKHSTSPDENDPGCEFYRRANGDARDSVVLTVDICYGRASAGAGVPNP